MDLRPADHPRFKAELFEVGKRYVTRRKKNSSLRRLANALASKKASRGFAWHALTVVGFYT